MKNNFLNKNIVFLSLLALVMTASVSSAQNTPASSTSENKDVAVEVYLPMNKAEFLLYYGVTTDDKTNTEIATLRDEFITKVEALKDEYKANLKDIVASEDLIPPTFVSSTKKDEVIKEEVIEARALRTINSQPQTKLETPTKTTLPIKYKLSTEKEINIAPLVTVSNFKTPYTETSSWFQKIKSFFRW